MPVPPRPKKKTAGLPPRGAPLRFHWSGFRPLFDFWGNEIKRYYRLETLASATEWMVSTKRDRFLIAGIQSVLGPAPVVSIHVELFQEGRHQLIFRLRALNAKRKEAQFAFVVSKRTVEESSVAVNEHANLQLLNQRAPEFVVRPFTGGKIYLPDRHGRIERGREVYAYLTQWLGIFHELGVTKELQFYINVKNPHTFTIAQTEAIKAHMVKTIVASYEATAQDCMAMPEIASGDFVVTWPKGRTSIPKIKLIACRKMLRRVTPAKLLDLVVSATWEWGGRTLHLAPEDPAMLYAGVAAALGKTVAREWFAAYVQAVSSKRLRERSALSLEAARDIAEGRLAPATI